MMIPCNHDRGECQAALGTFLTHLLGMKDRDRVEHFAECKIDGVPVAERIQKIPDGPRFIKIRPGILWLRHP